MHVAQGHLSQKGREMTLCMELRTSYIHGILYIPRSVIVLLTVQDISRMLTSFRE